MDIANYIVNRSRGQFGDNNTYNKELPCLLRKIDTAIFKTLSYSVNKHNIPNWALCREGGREGREREGGRP